MEEKLELKDYCWIGDLKGVQSELAKGIKIKSFFKDQSYVLYEAVYHENPESYQIAKLLIESKANVNVAVGEKDFDGNYGETPLHRCVMSGQPEMVKLLVENGADVTIVYYKKKSV